MIQYYKQIKVKALVNPEENDDKNEEKKTEISKSDIKNSISIRKDLEEEKKMTENHENHDNTEELMKNSIDEKLEENDQYFICEWWKNMKKSIVLENILSVIQYFNYKLDGVPDKQIEKKVKEF